MTRYTPGEVEAVLATYRRLFPHPSERLAGYWDWPRREPWGCLTTDFRTATVEKFEAFDRDLAGVTEAHRLREVALAHGLGFSLGVSPWTDDLLLRTVGPATRRLVLLLGHDWHPITSEGDHAVSPLVRTSIFDFRNYARAVPLDTGVLFLNLYPHFRPPGAPTMGKLPVSYPALVAGLDALVADLDAEVAGVISWGAWVFNALAGPGAGIKAAAGRATTVRLGGRTLPYHPFLHPAAYGFNTAAHREGYRAACLALALAAKS